MALDTLIPSSTDLAGDPAVISRAEALRPIVEAASDEIEDRRRLPPALLDKLHEAQLFRLLMPRSSNGIETDPITFFHVIETIARADASTAWCLSQAGGCSMSAAYLDLPVAKAIFGDDPRAVLAWGPGPRVKAIECEGGYKVTGVWAFASGGRHATWLGAHCPIWQADGSPRLGPNGRQLERTMLVKSGEVAWTDIWNTVGLRGTASDQFALTDHFVPAYHSITRDVITRESESECREPGPLYRMSAMTCYEVGFAGVALGIARAALDSFVDVAKNKVPRGKTEPAPRQRRGADQPRPGRGRHPLGARLPAAVDGRHLEGDLGRRQAVGGPPHHHSHGARPTPSTRRARPSISPTTPPAPPRSSRAIRWSAASATSTPSPSNCRAGCPISKPSAPG